MQLSHCCQAGVQIGFKKTFLPFLPGTPGRPKKPGGPLGPVSPGAPAAPAGPGGPGGPAGPAIPGEPMAAGFCRSSFLISANCSGWTNNKAFHHM